MKTKLLLLLVLTLSLSGFSQRKWTLAECVEYAMANNIDIKQKRLTKENSSLELNTNQLSRLPNLNANIGQNFNFGLAPSVSGVYTQNNSSNTSLGISTGVSIFEGYRVNNQIKASKFNVQACMADLEQAKEDLSLNIMSYYLQILFNREIYRISQEKVNLSALQVERTENLYKSGRAAESELYESKATLAADELSVTQAHNTLMLSMLDLAQLMELTEVDNFDVVEPNVDSLLDSGIAALISADTTYENAVATRPMIKSAEYRLDKSKSELKIAQSAYYPSIGFNASYSNGYYYYFTSQLLDRNTLGEQLSANSSFMLGLNMSIPIFNRMASKNNVKSVKLNIESQILELENNKKRLLKEVQQSYFNAVASIKKFESSQTALEAASMAFDFAQKKFEAGRSTTYEFNEAKNRLISSESNLVQAKYEYLFNCKILDYYNGQPLY